MYCLTKAFISGAINSIPCTKLLIDSGCETTCVSSSLVPPKCYTGKSVLLQSYRSSDKGEYVPLATVHLNIASFSRVVEVAVCSDMADEALLGSDLGLDTLSQWLHLVGNKTVCQTRAQAALEQAKEIADRDALASSGAVVHSLGDIFNFDDNFFTPEPMHATHPDPTNSLSTSSSRTYF